MASHGSSDSEVVRDLRVSLARGDWETFGALFARHRDRLRRMILLRLDRRVQGRLDPSDIIQDVFVEATRRVKGFLDNPCMPFYLWLRFLATQRLLQLHRRHLGVRARDARREISLHHGSEPEA